MQSRTTFFLISAFLIASALAVRPAPADAAALHLSGTPVPAVVGGEYDLAVSLDTEGQNINAVGAAVDFPSDLLLFKGWSDGGSAISVWVSPPHVDTASGTVSFSGIIPGGYSGAQGTVVTLQFTAIGPGSGSISARELQLLENDGRGTPAPASAEPLYMTSVTSAVPLPPNSPADDQPPLPFVPVVARDPRIFGGAWFISFSTTDTGSGVDYYEVKEGDSSFVRATSPYRLSDQSLSGPILVVAVDKSGNRQIGAYYPPSSARGIELALAVILLIVVVSLYISLVHFRKRRSGGAGTKR